MADGFVARRGCWQGTVISGAVGLSLAQYVLIALLGYGTFGDRVHSDLLTSYPPSPLLAGARALIALVVAFSYPLQSHPSRACILSLTQRCAAARRQRAHIASGSGGDAASSGAASSRHGTHAPPPPAHTHVLVTLCFLLLTTTLAVAVDDLSVVLSFVGATGSVIVSYLLPGLCYYRLQPDPRHPLRRGALALLLFGCVLMPLSLTLVVIKLLQRGT